MAKGDIIRSGTHTQPMQGKGKCFPTPQLASPSILGKKLPGNVHPSHFKCWAWGVSIYGDSSSPLLNTGCPLLISKSLFFPLAIDCYILFHRNMCTYSQPCPWANERMVSSSRNGGWGGREETGHFSQISVSASFILSFCWASPCATVTSFAISRLPSCLLPFLLGLDLLGDPQRGSGVQPLGAAAWYARCGFAF